MLSFNMPPARDLAAPAARSGNAPQPVLTRRDASASLATQPAAQEVGSALRYRVTVSSVESGKKPS